MCTISSTSRRGLLNGKIKNILVQLVNNHFRDEQES